MNNIMYGENTLGFRYQGRNGMGKQAGLALSVTRNAVEIEPINSRGHVANCFIQVPFDKIDEVIEGIRKTKANLLEQCPVCSGRNILGIEATAAGNTIECHDCGELWSVPADKPVSTKAKLEISSRWKCPKCGMENCGIGFGDLAETGVPLCGECGDDMEFVGEDICLAETSEVLYQS